MIIRYKRFFKSSCSVVVIKNIQLKMVKSSFCWKRKVVSISNTKLPFYSFSTPSLICREEREKFREKIREKLRRNLKTKAGL